MSFSKIAQVDEIPPGEMRKLTFEDKEILIVNIDGMFYAINNKCTHMGGDLSKGDLEGKIVKCPRHGSKFDVTTGEAVKGPKILFVNFNTENIGTYETKVDGKNLLIKKS
jgi:3-phenylpropionate/trans-cinnamate dioxygenase ferredoxin subunit